MAASVVVEDSVHFLVNPQLLEGAWTASASRLAELIEEYKLIADLATFYGRVEELRWRVRLRTEQHRTTLNEPIHALVVELQCEVGKLLKRVGDEIANPHVRRTGLVQRHSITPAIETSQVFPVEAIRGSDPAEPPDSDPRDG